MLLNDIADASSFAGLSTMQGDQADPGGPEQSLPAPEGREATVPQMVPETGGNPLPHRQAAFPGMADGEARARRQGVEEGGEEEEGEEEEKAEADRRREGQDGTPREATGSEEMVTLRRHLLPPGKEAARRMVELPVGETVLLVGGGQLREGGRGGVAVAVAVVVWASGRVVWEVHVAPPEAFRVPGDRGARGGDQDRSKVDPRGNRSGQAKDRVRVSLEV